jgi:hypothetical protein
MKAPPVPLVVELVVLLVVELVVLLVVELVVLVVELVVPPPPPVLPVSPPHPSLATPAVISNVVAAASGPARCQNDLCLASVMLPPLVSRFSSPRGAPRHDASRPVRSCGARARLRPTASPGCTPSRATNPVERVTKPSLSFDKIEHHERR